MICKFSDLRPEYGRSLTFLHARFHDSLSPIPTLQIKRFLYTTTETKTRKPELGRWGLTFQTILYGLFLISVHYENSHYFSGF